jgi:predicted negative regulator of RcsB-dependent stress response
MLAATAAADPEQDAERALIDAQQRAARGDPTAIDALEALGARQPVTRWTDDAWRTAAHLAERAQDYERARRDLDRVIATTDDERVAQRARGDLKRIVAIAGESGQWATVAAAHERLATRARGPGDPRSTLRELEALVRDNPGYPRAAMAMLAIAQGWEREAEPERAIHWLQEATRAATTPTDKTRCLAELARTFVRHGDLDEARATIAQIGDPILAAELRGRVAAAEVRRTIRWIAFALLFALTGVAAFACRRAAGSWRLAARALLRPPTEALFVAPIAALLAVVAQAGNPLVARAIVAIAITGTAIAWISGAILDRKRGTLRLSRLVLHAVLAMLAVLAAVYIAVDRAQMIDLVIETWRGGPAH